jgi:hypothetical protein
VASEDSINFQSLNVVRDELVATIETAAKDLELFVSSKQDDADALQNSINGIQQIVGIFKVLQFGGAGLLAEELSDVANEISPGSEGKAYDRKMEVISNTFFILTRYLEYVQQFNQKTPVLLIPHINALRRSQNKTVLSESHFLPLSASAEIQLPNITKVKPVDGDFKKEVARIRHMYQIGLIGIMRQEHLERSISLMRRAMTKMLGLGGTQKGLCKLWWLTDIALECFTDAAMGFIETRKYLFTRIEKVMSQIEAGGEKALGVESPKGLIKELVYLITLSGLKSERVQSIQKAFGLSRFPYTDADLKIQFDAMYGPSAHTMNSLSSVLLSEITNTKRVLEGAAQSSTQEIDDLESFISTLKNISEILAVIGLTSASGSLKTQIKLVATWGNKPIPHSELDEVANTLLYLESTVQGLDNSALSADKINTANNLAQQQAVASNELASAIKIVVEESLAGLSLTKRGLNSFAESNYDTGHIKNISKILTSIRGAMSIMRRSRAEDVLDRSANFVNEVLLDQDLPAAIHEILETFADVVIAIEYYFDSTDVNGKMDESVLKIAEESLDALGYAIEE